MKIAVIKQTIALVEDETLIRDMDREIPVTFTFDSTWDGCVKTALFKAGSVEESVTLTNDRCILPATLLKTAGVLLKVRAQGNGSDTPETSWGLISRILYPSNVDIPVSPTPGPSPTPEGEVGRLCEDFATELESQYTEDELKDKSLAEVIGDMDGLDNTATNQQVEDLLNDVWGSDEELEP